VTKTILDPCCGGRMFYFDKQDPRVLFCDYREVKLDLMSNGRTIEIKPDVVADVTALPFPNASFWHVVLDPPHLIRVGENSYMGKKYGRLPPDWRTFLHDAFAECWRVLRSNGTLIFKWSACQIPVAQVVDAIGRQPLYGQRNGKQSNTHWLVYVKEGNAG